MNGTFRAQEPQMLGQRRQQMMKDREEELQLFLEMRKREKERNDLLNNAEEFDAPLGSKPNTSSIFNLAPSAPSRKLASDDFLNADSDKNDYDWLLTPPGTPLFPSLEMESQKTLMSQLGTPKARPTTLKSRLANAQAEPVTMRSLTSRQPASSPGLNSSVAGARRPSSSSGPGSRPASPAGRPTLTTSSKTSRASTPTSRPILPSSRSSLPSTRPSPSTTRPAGPSTKPSVAAAKPTVPSRSSTPSRSTVRSSTPTSRPTIPHQKPASRSATPTRRPSTPSSAPIVPLNKSSSSVAKPSSAAGTSRNPVPSRGASPTVKSRPWKPSEMPGFSLEAPPNLRTSLPERPLSATRGRPGAPSSRSSYIEPSPPGRPRRQSCSPSRGRLTNGGLHPSGSSVPAMGRNKITDDISPVLIGTQMVERVINMRKLVPPKQDHKHSPHSNLSGKSASSPDGSGFGLTLSKKSLDMAIRHMDIRRSIPGNMRPLMTNIPASSMYSVRSGSGPTRGSRTTSALDSPLATSSNASSEVSANNKCLCSDRHQIQDDVGNERDGLSPATARGRGF